MFGKGICFCVLEKGLEITESLETKEGSVNKLNQEEEKKDEEVLYEEPVNFTVYSPRTGAPSADSCED